MEDGLRGGLFLVNTTEGKDKNRWAAKNGGRGQRSTAICGLLLREFLSQQAACPQVAVGYMDAAVLGMDEASLMPGDEEEAPPSDWGRRRGGAWTRSLRKSGLTLIVALRAGSPPGSLLAYH